MTTTHADQAWTTAWANDRGVRSGSLDTVDDSLSGRDSETDEGAEYTRQQSADMEDSHATADDRGRSHSRSQAMSVRSA